MSDKYIIMLQIMDSEKVQDLDISKKVSVQLQYTDPDLKSRDRVLKKAEKDGLYNALDLASVGSKERLQTDLEYSWCCAVTA
jgi:hypothetical protein